MDLSSLFDNRAADYDRNRRQVIPCFDDFYDTFADVLPFAPDAKIRILDLGAGTGLLTACLAARFGQAHCVLADSSKGMLAKARERFAGEARFEFQVLDFGAQPLPTSFDVVASALAIHHLPGEEKLALFRKVRASLNPGGAFLVGDLVLGPSPQSEALYQRIWAERAKKAGLSDADWRASVASRNADRTSTLTVQLDWLRAAGFADVDCWYKSFVFAVFGGCAAK